MKTLVSTFLMTVLATAFYVPEADAALDEDIVLAMSFDEGKGETTKDLSAHANHGTLMQNAGWAKGKFGNGIIVEPVGYVDAGNDPSLSLSKTDFTLAAWVHMKDTVVHQHGFMGHDEGGGTTNKWIFRYNKGGSQSINFHINRADGAGVNQLEPGVWKTKPNTWYQAAVVRSGNKYTFYTDGTRNGQIESDVAVPKFIDAPVTIGWAEGPIALDGRIDEALIAKRAFTADEIKSHFQGGVKQVLAVQPVGKAASIWGTIKTRTLR